MKKFLIFLAFAACDLGVIAKYGLPGSPLLPEGSSNPGFWHIGIILGF